MTSSRGTNPDALLRQYEVRLPNGYPWEWAHETLVDPDDEKGPRLPAIKDYIRELASHRCIRCYHPYPPGISETCPRGEWTPCDDLCTHGAPYRYRPAGEEGAWRISPPGTELDLHEFGPEGALVQRWEAEAHWRILTVHHLDEDKTNCRWWNLAALCQRCHLRMQRAVVMGRPYHYEHSEWFKPHAAGFYAWKYLGEDLDRETTMARLDELLALEHRFTQEALL